MTAPYRDELAALEARHAALEAEVADRERARDEAARMLADARARRRNEEIAADVRAGGPEQRRQRQRLVGATFAMLVLAGAAVYGLATRKLTRAQRIDAVMTQFARFSDEMCACQDRACADGVQDRMARWAQEAARADDFRDATPDAELVERATKINERYIECMTTLQSLGTERFP